MNQQLKDFMAAKGLQQKQVAQMLGVSIATVSLYLKGGYAGNVKELDDKVQAMIARHKDKVVEARYNAEFVRTFAARQGMEVMKIAHVEGEINVIYGAAGLGKTQMLKQYARENSGVMLLELEPSCTPKVLLRKIGNAAGANIRGNNNEMFDSLVDKLKGSERVLLVDEAELLSTRSLEFIRRLHDLTGIGVVLVGMPRLIVNLKGKNNELAQLFSRVGFACDLGNALTNDDLAMLAESALGTDEFNEPLINACNGNARRLSKLIRGVVRSSEINGIRITTELVEQYAKMLIN